MEEYSAQLLAQSAHDYLSWDEGLAYVSRRISPVTYEAISPAGFWPRKNAQGRWTFGLKSDAGDPEQYLISERTQGRSISYGDFYLRSLGPILLTWRVHESIATVWGYLREGSRGRTPFAWQGHGIIVQPPLVSGYILAHGTLWDAAFLWKRAGTGNWHRVTLGTDADWIGSGDLAKLHLAFENPLFKLALPWGKQHASASLAQSFTWRKKPFDWIGYEVRSDLHIGLMQHADLQLSFANSHNDIIAHDVLLQQNGYRVSAGLNGSFP